MNLSRRATARGAAIAPELLREGGRLGRRVKVRRRLSRRSREAAEADQRTEFTRRCEVSRRSAKRGGGPVPGVSQTRYARPPSLEVICPSFGETRRSLMAKAG